MDKERIVEEIRGILREGLRPNADDQVRVIVIGHGYTIRVTPAGEAITREVLDERVNEG